MRKMERAFRLTSYGIAAAYAYGAYDHVANMASLSGFDWPFAPLKWQGLDIVYLVLDLVVVAGVILARRVWIIAFGIAATSQIVLYTVLRSWVLDVPAAFVVSPESENYLTGLVAFHLVSLTIVGALLFFTKPSQRLT